MSFQTFSSNNYDKTKRMLLIIMPAQFKLPILLAAAYNLGGKPFLHFYIQMPLIFYNKLVPHENSIRNEN